MPEPEPINIPCEGVELVRVVRRCDAIAHDRQEAARMFEARFGFMPSVVGGVAVAAKCGVCGRAIFASEGRTIVDGIEYCEGCFDADIERDRARWRAEHEERRRRKWYRRLGRWLTGETGSKTAKD